ncbi:MULTISPECIES: asparagine synthase (glutamine-hydrolyzing) [unclassified Nostoc]|uniref:asparagine synthase (glutamine-hydrolyzing) n=1 Tax=unclassified Nostoc TaxID=2593658 RepID=UPI002AD3A9F4|nr:MULTISPECIES: asparagine synthase (glutamine-hydrolyzing) [unclassified Nostoc]MDZ8125972.1 asparagine synthase (glutamine-hydrolyzing) [Nostoc sp. CmiVER01]MDZ8225838.1 asparagine synthase (glutamine-hydrolyzing) [Nostoc sp. ChiVER01]
MCGIYGYIGREDFNTSNVLAALHHRGPDSQGTWQRTVGANHIHLLHTRLAIVDLSPAGHQPMVDAKTGNVIIFNGEIYNFLELRQELKAQGVEFTSHSDTEVLLLGYRVWGEQIVKRLDGMFAFLLFDFIQQRLLLARDHIGIKPLYYAQTRGGGIALASEVRALISSGLVATDWDEQSISEYLIYGSVQEPRTIRQAIKAFPPAHYAYIDLQTDLAPIFIPICYWNLAQYASNQIREPTFQTSHTKVLLHTLKEQLIADVPVGLFLSAGIDSTVLASMLAPVMQGHLSTFTLDLQDSTRDESNLAAMTAQKLQLKHHVAYLSHKTLNTWLFDSFSAMDQPSSDGTNIYLISRASLEQGITVVLSGCGADELHGGYPHFVSIAKLYQLGKCLGDLKSILVPWIENIKGWRKHTIYQERLNLLFQQIDSPSRMLKEMRRFFTPKQISAFLTITADYDNTVANCDDETDSKLNLDVETLISLGEIQGYLRNTLLRDSDWATMANQQELRVPYLGKRYIEKVMQIPWSDKRTTKKQKKPLLSSQIPPTLQHPLNRQKTGFDLDYAMYLSGPLRDCLHAAFTHLNQGYGFELNADRVEHDLKIGDPAKQVRRYWALTSLGFYLQKHS